MIKQRQKISTKDITQIAVMIAIIVVLAQISMPLPLGVPFTLQTLAVMLTGIIFGPIKGGICIAVYIAMGTIGLPVFAGFSGGLSVILGPTGGFILGFLPATIAIGLLSKPNANKTVYYVKLLIGLFIGQLIIFTIGVLWFMQILGRDLNTAIEIALIPFIIPEIIKTTLAIMFGTRISAITKTRR
ncbi:MAG: biotin transporter BioY [Firmicutes bacterium]|nr:biotin transporter BioY [Bacillota bacterium]